MDKDNNGGDVDLGSILAARERIADIVKRTELRHSSTFSTHVNGDVYLKLENQQPTGSFKIRGAANAIRATLEHGEIRGVTTASTGNHARAVAYVARQHDLPVRAFLPRNTSGDRIADLRRHGANVNHTTHNQAEAIEGARTYAEEHEYAFIPPFDDPAVISGQGTLGLELLETQPHLDIVIIPISGGGLAAGVALAIKSQRPETHIIGVCAENVPAMKASLEVGHPVRVPDGETVAESLRGDLGPDNRFTFRLVQQHVDTVALVTENAIITAHHQLHHDHHICAEEAAAAATAYLQTHPIPAHHTVAAIVSGHDRKSATPSPASTWRV
jgi:threonine dehydratase